MVTVVSNLKCKVTKTKIEVMRNKVTTKSKVGILRNKSQLLEIMSQLQEIN